MVRNGSPPSPTPIVTQTVNILLIEDNLAEVRLLQEVLKGVSRQRFTLTHAQRLRDGLQQLAPCPEAESPASPFEIILLDLTLPDSQGLASLDAVIAQTPGIPIVVLTNTNDDELAVEAVRHGAQDYLVKRQLTQDSLVRSLRYAIERKQAAEALREINETLEHRVQERTAELETSNQLLRQEILSRESIQERLTLAQQAGQLGTFECDMYSGQVTWSSEIEALYRVAPGTFANSIDPWLTTLHPADRSYTAQSVQQALETGHSLETEFRILWPNGEQRWMAAKGSVFQNQPGHPQRLIGFHMDITEKKLLEAKFLRAQRLESLGTLASGIAHDLNNILTPMLAIAQLLPLKFPQLNEQSQNMLVTLEASARRGADLIKQILSFARGLEGQNINLQVRHLLVEIRQLIGQTFPKSVEISADFPADLWIVKGDLTQLHQVLMNLCVNARDAMPEGGTLSMSAANVTLDEAAVRQQIDVVPGQYVAITIGDSGSGISSDIMDRIFDPFFTTKDIGKGTGLGLSAVVGIVKSHGGFLDLQSTVGVGSQFTIFLPAVSAVVLPPETHLDPLLGDQELILVVDDETAICDIIQTVLETYNYRVFTTQDAAAAISAYALHQQQIKAVLLDVMMPGMDGLATLPFLQRLNAKVRVIAMSGVNSPEVINPLKQAGCQHFLAKPFTHQGLLRTLKESLAIHR